MPPTPANTQSEALRMLPMATPISIPMKHKMDETQLYTMACFTDIPARSNTAKSPGNKQNKTFQVTHSEVSINSLQQLL